MIERIDNHQIPDVLKESPSEQTNPSKISAENESPISWQVDFDSLIEAAKQIPAEDAQAMRRARELLLAGNLDSPERTRWAAENIAAFGI
jgi:hypothetical protein